MFKCSVYSVLEENIFMSVVDLFSHSNEMKPLDEDLKDIILRALPLISEDTQQSLIHKLLSDGVESNQDLKFVIEDDIADLLPPLQLQTLLEAFKNGNVDVNTLFFLYNVIVVYLIISNSLFLKIYIP